MKYQAYKNKKVGDEYSLIFKYEQVLTDDMKPAKSVTKECDVDYCKKVTKEANDRFDKSLSII